MPSKRSAPSVGDAADADVAFAFAAGGAGDEGVGEDDGAGARAGGEVGADAVQCRGEHGLVGGCLGVQLGAYQGGLEVGHSVDGDGAVFVVEEDGAGSVGGVGAQVDAGFGVQAGAGAEAVGRVVVAADHDGGDAEVGELVQSPVEQAYSVQARDGTVVDVARDQQGVHLLGRAVAQMWSRTLRWWSIRSSPWNRRPRCQSEVCRNLMGTDRNQCGGNYGGFPDKRSCFRGLGTREGKVSSSALPGGGAGPGSRGDCQWQEAR
jgi:hypothetical protein